MVGQFMPQGLAQLALPVLVRPVLFTGQGGKRAVIQLNIPAHLVFTELAEDVDLVLELGVEHCVRQQADAAVQALKNSLRQFFCHLVKQIAGLVKAQNHSMSSHLKKRPRRAQRPARPPSHH